MTVDDCYRILGFICRKNKLGSLNPQDFQDAFNTAQRNYYDLLVGRIEQYRYDSPNPRIGLSMSDNVVSRLSQFLYSSTISVSSGVATKPTGFNKLLSMYTTDFFRIYRMDEDRFSERYQDSIDPIDKANAFFVEQGTSWTIYPTSITQAIVRYLKVPASVVWGYTLDGSGRPVYNSGTSIQPLWYDNDIDEILGRAAKIVGVSIKEPVLQQYGQSVINTVE
jgi:hypothetical protein